jgi:ubiquitin carboxyl-terminal hydrolase 7
MYIDVADSVTMPYGWTRFAQFSLSVVNQANNKYSIRKGKFFSSADVR